LILGDFLKVENPPSWTVLPFLNIFQITLLQNFSTIEYLLQNEEYFEKSQFLKFRGKKIVFGTTLISLPSWIYFVKIPTESCLELI
jgi:hypothetical protein